ncbi:MAG: hypothetical protein H0U74_23520 [Bradymonadaceae bacterium]|nr:hypothetical protein [Lujinxingiaceae bacterium]
MNSKRSFRGACGLALIALIFAGTLGCAGVKPIDLHDASVPIEGRRLVADAQDGIAIARAQQDNARVSLRASQKWRNDIASLKGVPGGATDVLAKLNELAAVRLRLSEIQLERANAELELAVAKYDLVTARVAVRNDLAVYDLEKLNLKAEAILNRAREIDRQTVGQLEHLDKVTRAWWTSYTGFVQGGGDARTFFAAFERTP